MNRTPTREGKGVSGYVRHPGSAWIDDHRSELPNNEWVAANQSGLVANDVTYDGLLNQIRSKMVDPADVTVAFITSDSA